MVFRLMFVLVLLLPFGASAQDVKSFDGQYFFSNAGTNNNVDSCPLLPSALQKKVSVAGGLSKEEFEHLAIGKGHNYLAINSGQNFYHKKTNIILNEDEFIVHLNKLDHTDPANLARVAELREKVIYGNVPVLCGKHTPAQKAAQVAAKEDAARNCVFCNYRGGQYLEAIYNNDFELQNYIAARYLGQIAGAGGDEIMAVGVLMNAVGGQGNDFTYLEDVVGYYLLSTSRNWKGQCYGPGSQKVTFTTTYPEQVYETLGGISLGSDPGYTVVTHYMVRPPFKQACHAICNKNGGILFTARIAGASGKKMAALEVFHGIDEMVKTHGCDSAVVKQFERNLLSMWEQEKAQPRSVSRNTIGSYFK